MSFPISTDLQRCSDRRLFVEPVYDLHLTLRGRFPGARRGNCQFRALAATMDGERGRGVFERRWRRRQCRDLRPIVHRRRRLADDPVRALRLRGIGFFNHFPQELVDAFQSLQAFKL